ncbi:MAG: Cell division protein FtsX [Desulfotomaculum sp. 46_296]|nr:MAG: Cell division protein FtsX [Desulfotomaculum sp. 46_296]KUK84341.1 MAG: Cell division protein FtsX [Desulfofundulus kuznetsovii]HAU31662.1 cell division protein FtsX [Desulfotomaculum sp.]
MGHSAAGYYFKEAVNSLVRNNWLSLASVGVVTVSLFILGCFLLAAINTSAFINTLESMLEINVFLESNLNKSEINHLKEQLKFLPGVSEVEFVSREKALENMLTSLGNEKDITENLDENPLPDSFRVKTKSVELAPQVAANIYKFNGVSNVIYGQEVVERLLIVTRWIRITSLTSVVVLGLAAVFLISTTIRVSVFSRRKEIGIMKFLGATNWFVRFPFLLEGVVLGFSGALLASIIVYLVYTIIIDKIAVTMPFLPIVGQMDKLAPVYLGLLVLGLLIGAAGSSISVHRFLKV